MPSQAYHEYQKEKYNREWERKVADEKKKLSNQERLERAGRYKNRGNERFKCGTIQEAIEYYREAVEYIHDLNTVLRVERSALLVPLHLNLARCYTEFDKQLHHANKVRLQLQWKKHNYQKIKWTLDF